MLENCVNTSRALLAEKPRTLVLSDGLLNTTQAKTAHGLLRKTNRFDIVGVIDRVFAGTDICSILPDVNSVPVFQSIGEARSKLLLPPECAVVGVAPHGGKPSEVLRSLLRDAIASGLDVVSGLHHFVSTDEELGRLAAIAGVRITDLRKPRPKELLKFWSGSVLGVTTPVVAVLGMDCTIGKRTTAQAVVDQYARNGRRAEMIYTGQTGWMQGARYGFILDATPKDFLSGELEHAVVQCAETESPDLIILEGQSSLRNPAGPDGSLLLISANARGVILQHDPKRVYFDGQEGLGVRIPSIESEIALIRAYGSEVIAISLNTSQLSDTETADHKVQISEATGVPVYSIFHGDLPALALRLEDWAGAAR